MLAALTLSLCCSSGTPATAEVLSHFRFEPGDGLWQDSVGDVTLQPFPLNQQSTAVAAVDLPSTDRGRNFPNGFDGLGSNAGAIDIQRSFFGLVGENASPVSDDFTIELFTHIDDLSKTRLAVNLAGQLSKALTAEGHSWSFKIRNDGFNGTAPGELAFANSDGSSWFAPPSGILIEEQKDYFLAGSFNLTENLTTYYAHDLENNSLQITSVPHGMSSLNPDSTIVIGDADCSCLADGLIDEVRFSRGAVPFSDLLIHDAEFEQPGYELPDSVILGPRQFDEVRSDGVFDRRLADLGNLDDSRRNIAKFQLPQFDDIASQRLDEAKLRIYVRLARDPATAELSVWHSQADNDFIAESTDFDDASYTDTLLDIFTPDDVAKDYFEIDITDFVREDYALDGADPVTALRLQTSGESRVSIAMPGDHLHRPQLVLSFSDVIFGDFNEDGNLNVQDIDLLTAAIQNADMSGDLNADESVDRLDLEFWVHDLKKTWFGDANLDGEFNSGDLVDIFQAGHYEDGVAMNSGWAEGDWNSDGEFDTSDLVLAFQGGGYERGVRTMVNAVPEPSSAVLLMLGLFGFVRRPCRPARTRRSIACSTEKRRWARVVGQVLIGIVFGIVLGGQFPQPIPAQIIRLDTGEVIPGTEGIFPGPGVQLEHRDLQRASLSRVDLTGANLAGSNLAAADLSSGKLTGVYCEGAEMQSANLSRADLTRAELAGSNLVDTNLSGATIAWASLFNVAGLTKEQLYSTASYQEKNLQSVLLGGTDDQGLSLQDIDLSDQDLRDAFLSSERLPQDLTNANLRGANLALGKLSGATLAEADMRGTNLANANLSAADLASTQFDSTTTYTEWTRWPEDFNPSEAGLTLLDSVPGDFDANGILDAVDLEHLQDFITARSFGSWRFNPMGSGSVRLDFEIEPLFDLNEDGRVDLDDHRVWVMDLKQTYYGDANLDGEFNSGDLVHIFAAREYEDDARVNSTWSTGDLNGDWEFTTADLVVAFQDGGYEQGLRTAQAAAVPESTGGVLMLALIGLGSCSRMCAGRRHQC